VGSEAQNPLDKTLIDTRDSHQTGGGTPAYYPQVIRYVLKIKSGMFGIDTDPIQADVRCNFADSWRLQSDPKPKGGLPSPKFFPKRLAGVLGFHHHLFRFLSAEE